MSDQPRRRNHVASGCLFNGRFHAAGQKQRRAANGPGFRRFCSQSCGKKLTCVVDEFITVHRFHPALDSDAFTAYNRNKWLRARCQEERQPQGQLCPEPLLCSDCKSYLWITELLTAGGAAECLSEYGRNASLIKLLSTLDLHLQNECSPHELQEVRRSWLPRFEQRIASRLTQLNTSSVPTPSAAPLEGALSELRQLVRAEGGQAVQPPAGVAISDPVAPIGHEGDPTPASLAAAAPAPALSRQAMVDQQSMLQRHAAEQQALQLQQASELQHIRHHFTQAAPHEVSQLMALLLQQHTLQQQNLRLVQHNQVNTMAVMHVQRPTVVAMSSAAAMSAAAAARAPKRPAAVQEGVRVEA